METNEKLPADFEKNAKARFEQLAIREVTFEEFLAHEGTEFQRRRAVEANRVALYVPSIGTITPCGNGNLDDALNPAEWQGGNGTRTTGTTPINFAALTGGLFSGIITLPQSHQTWVPAGVDPNAGIPTTAQGSAGAVRIGNAVNGWGCELLSKTFVVTPALSTITFWYAVVLQNPLGHPPDAQPFFRVRVTDSSGNVVPSAFDFGAGSDTLIADSANPFFQTAPGIVYKDWACAQIDLSTQVGNQVTIEFVTADCGYGGHWGYAYIDSLCGNCQGSPTGDITYDCEQSTHCGPGQICFDYVLPKIGSNTGSVTITLDIYQNGTLLTQLTSPVLTSGSSTCFGVVPASIPGINLSLGGFDFTATAAFAIGNTSLGHIKVGTPPDGITPGRNNDYRIACKSCAEIERDQAAVLAKLCGKKLNLLPRTSCDCPDAGPADHGDCRCDCRTLDFHDVKPCISVAWGDSKCDCLETDDVEVLCVTVCNCYSNVTFNDLTIGQIQVTDTDGQPVPTLPDGTPSVQVIPSGPICFGDIPPCKAPNQPGCVSRELVIHTRGAVGKDYRLSFAGVCFSVSHQFQAQQCFILKLCQD